MSAESNEPIWGHDSSTGCSSILIGKIFPSAINDKIYSPISFGRPTPGILAMAKDVKERGILEPIVISGDFYIISGHRRYAAAQMAGLKRVPVRMLEHVVSRTREFSTLLVAFNRQREKTYEEILRETLVQVDRGDAYKALRVAREARAAVDVETVDIVGSKERAAITSAKRPFLDAAIAAIESLKPFHPVSVRQIHYQLLNSRPLTHASKPDSQYANNLASYRQLSDLLTRARLKRLIRMDVIADETRPVIIGDSHRSATDYLRREIDGFLRGYYRDLQQSQPNHIEIVAEKNTLSNLDRLEDRRAYHLAKMMAPMLGIKLKGM